MVSTLFVLFVATSHVVSVGWDVVRPDCRCQMYPIWSLHGSVGMKERKLWIYLKQTIPCEAEIVVLIQLVQRWVILKFLLETAPSYLEFLRLNCAPTLHISLPDHSIIIFVLSFAS
jgi:hypothetical protein